MKKLLLTVLIVAMASLLAAYVLYHKSILPIRQITKSGKPPISIFTDHGKQELAKLVKYYSGLQSIEIKYTISLLNDAGKELENGIGMLVQDSTGFYVKTLGFEQMAGNGYMIAISEEQQTFSAYPISRKEEDFIVARSLESIFWTDSLHLFPDSIVEWGQISKNRCALKLHVDNGMYYKTELEYNPSTLELFEIRMFLIRDSENTDSENMEDMENSNPEFEGAVVVYHYDNIKMNKNVDHRYFDPLRFIRLDKGKIYPKAKYHEFEIMSNPEN